MPGEEFSEQARWKFLVQIAVSGIVLIASLVIIFSNNYPDATMKWAFGLVGVVIGYWLR